MVPGLTSPGGRLPPGAASEGGSQEDGEYGTKDLEADEVVVVEAEGKENACMVGVLKMGTKEMKEVKKGVAIEDGHFLGDGLWKMRLD